MTALIAAGLATAIGSSAHGQDSTNQVAYSIQLQATIDPATEKWVSSALDDAASQDAAVVIIRLDTPGGLVDSLRSIVQDMAAAPMPVIVYVSPNGARAASAGAYITEAADVAAMAPETNIGSATPIAIDAGGGTSDLDRKIVNDAAASMRALAADHGRNAKLADELVTKATNLTAEEALDAGLIDRVAPSQEALLRKLDGFRVQGPKAQTLHTAGLQVENHDMPLQYDLLEIIVNPTVSYLLILVGIVGLGIELFAPGAIAPGAIGLVSFLLGLYGTAQLPVTAAGVLLLVVGVALIIAEAHLSAHGILGAAGVVALVASGLLLYDTNTSAFEVSAPVVIAAGLLIGGFLAFAVDRAVRARRRPVRTGWEEMVGAAAVVREPLDPVGMVYVEGALWRAKLQDGADGRALDRGARVRVEAVDGLTLKVRPVEAEPEREEGAS
jgi:membrane-bound serine protease (ClpP class)